MKKLLTRINRKMRSFWVGRLGLRSGSVVIVYHITDNESARRLLTIIGRHIKLGHRLSLYGNFN